ncbi:MAG TPA: hypothetical protein VIY51_00345 [Xanthobacteraceae bacterium]
MWQPKIRNRAVAKVLGINRQTVDRDVGTNVPPSLAGPAVAKLAAKAEAKAERARLWEIGDIVDVVEVWEIAQERAS